MLHHDTVTISKSHSILMIFIDLIKKNGLPVKIPIKHFCLLIYQLCYHFYKHFWKQKSFLFSYFVNLDKKASECKYRRRKSTGTKTIKTIDSWRDYQRYLSIVENTITIALSWQSLSWCISIMMYCYILNYHHYLELCHVVLTSCHFCSKDNTHGIGCF